MLYVIIPYFNFENNKYREENIYNFIEKYKLENNVKIIVSEGFIENKLENLDQIIFKHLAFRTEQKIWIKENLINLAIKNLPNNYEYVSWIDGDIEFENVNWVEETLDKLKIYDALQLFEEVIHLDKNKEILKLNYIPENVITNQYGQPGFAWAFNKNIFNKIDCILESDIVGMGDNFMARCLNNKIPFIHPSLKNKIKTSCPIVPTSINYYNILTSYYLRCKNLKIGHISGNIKHFWHGDFDKRLYWERWSILEKYNYDPNIHIIKNKDGLIQVKKNYLDLIKDIEQYFNTREN